MVQFKAIAVTCFSNKEYRIIRMIICEIEKWNDGLNVKMILVNYIHSIYSRGFKILSKKIGFTKYFFFCFISKMERVELFLKIFKL